MLRATMLAVGLLAGLAGAVPEAFAQSSEPAATETPRTRTRTRSTNTTATPRQPSAAQLSARQRMRDCGAQWRAIRGTPQARNQTWRSFSRDCLRRARAEIGGARTRPAGSF